MTFFFALANKNETARSAKSLMNRLFTEKCALTEEMQRDDDAVENSNMKSETGLKS
jgi:hypothetical protein